MLLEADGLAEPWIHGVQVQHDESDWLGELGENDAEDFCHFAPFAVARMSVVILSFEPLEAGNTRNNVKQCVDDSSSTATQPLVPADEMSWIDDTSNIEYAEDGAIILNSLSYADFRSRLVEHFTILHKNKMSWPSKKKVVTTN